MINTFCFLHGFGSNARSFFALQQALIDNWDHNKGYEILGLEFAGFGKRSEIDVSPKPMDAAIKEIIDTIQDREKITLVAHSMGGIPILPTASWLSEKYPEQLKSVVLIEGNLVAEDCGDIARRFRDAGDISELTLAKHTLVRDCATSEIPSIQRWGKAIDRVKMSTLQAYAGPLISESEQGNLSLNFKALADKGVPIRYIHGEGKVGHSVLDTLKGYDTVHIPNAGHFVHEDQPESVAREILAMM